MQLLTFQIITGIFLIVLLLVNIYLFKKSTKTLEEARSLLEQYMVSKHNDNIIEDTIKQINKAYNNMLKSKEELLNVPTEAQCDKQVNPKKISSPDDGSTSAAKTYTWH